MLVSKVAVEVKETKLIPIFFIYFVNTKILFLSLVCVLYIVCDESAELCFIHK